MPQEVEIKFQVADLRGLARKLRGAGFRPITPRTREMNTLYDLPGNVLRNRKELLRLRQYGSSWKLTHKSGSKRERHSSREELETSVEDGTTMHKILQALGYLPSFRYDGLDLPTAYGRQQELGIGKALCARRITCLGELEKDDVITEALGEHIANHFLAAKRQEWQDYITQVSPWELDNYLAKY